jgi:RNA polymerase sigma-70 factor (ECF subfamily)
MSDNIQIINAQNGDKRAFNDLVNHWYPKIYNFAYKYFAAEDLAEEVAQRTFIAVFQKLEQLKQPERFKAWLFQIAGNLCHEEQRRKKKKWTVSWLWSASGDEDESYELPLPDDRMHANPEAHFEQNELAELLQKALHKLPEEQRIIVIMKECEGFKFNEIAEILAISENTAKSRLYYGLKALKKILNPSMVGIES